MTPAGAARSLSPILVTLAAAACAGHSDDGAEHQDQYQGAVVYGTDDRREPFEVTDLTLRTLAEGASVALMARDSVTVQGDTVSLRSPPTLGESLGLCPEERFLDQPAAALCTGVLVSSRLVLTAGHCARQIPCASMRVVRGYRYESEGRLARLTPDDVTDCKEIVAQERSLPDATERLDYAWIALEAPLDGGPEVELRSPEEPLAVGEPVTTFGFSQGVPLKVDAGGKIADTREDTLDYFVTTTDTFHGASGAGVFDARLRLIGVFGRGADDYVTTDPTCATVASLPDDAAAASEQATYAFRAFEGRDAACAAGASPAACGTDPGGTNHGEAGCSVGRGGARPWLAGALVFVGLGAVWRRRPRPPVQATRTPC